MSLIRVVAVAKTSCACPSQWQGQTEDGRVIYARYRWGRVTVGVGRNTMEAVDSALHRPLVAHQHGGELEGWMTYNVLKLLTREVIEWPRKELN